MSYDEMVVIEGTTFVLSHQTGDILPSTSHGFYHKDTRYLARYELLINRRQTKRLSSGNIDAASASFFTLNAGSSRLPNDCLTVARDRYVENGFHDDVSIKNQRNGTVKFRLTIHFNADFADVFEVRLGNVRKKGHIKYLQVSDRDFCFDYRRGDFRRQTFIHFSETPEFRQASASFDLELAPGSGWHTCISVIPVEGEALPQPVPCRSNFFGEPFVQEGSEGETGGEERAAASLLPSEKKHQEWVERAPQISTEWLPLRLAYEQAVDDLGSLRLSWLDEYQVYAAGLPWYMTIFGRDSIISALQTVSLNAQLAAGTVRILAQYQANDFDSFREAQPGKIPHEVRQGELSILEEVPHSRYYGTVDATPLFLVLLHEAYLWTGDLDLVRDLLPAAEAALNWIDRYGDLDGDGFVEYRGKGRGFRLKNQGWKDSRDSIRFADGALARGPIALAEVQGYVYDARRRMAALYGVLEQPARADQLMHEADLLKKRFNQSFWMPGQEYYALALDGDKRQVDSITSNPGHCLWSGIVDDDKAEAVARRLMAADMFSGWGIRTMSSQMAAYNPISYHNGSVWPHDNSLIAMGLQRYGFHDKALRIIHALVEASGNFPRYRLPELFAGYPKRSRSFPVEYPTANSPQAWASGAIIFLVQALLGLHADGNRLTSEPLPDAPLVRLADISYRGQPHTFYYPYQFYL